MDPVLDTPRPDTAARASAAPAPPAATGGLGGPERPAPAPRCGVYETVLPAGPLRLRIDAPALRHAADAAIALQRCEPLLQALEAWIGPPLDWHWTEIPRAPAPRGSMARARWALDAETPGTEAPHGSIELPWALLRALPAPDGALAQRLQWPALQVELALSRPRLAPDELEQLEPGGALLLAESFTLPWHGLLRAAGEANDGAHGVAVRLETPLAPRLAPGAALPGDEAGTGADEAGDGRHACEVRLDLPAALPARRLAGWEGEAALAPVGPGAALWLLAEGRHPALCLARGRLMPWGSGWALAIENLGEANDATLPGC